MRVFDCSCLILIILGAVSANDYYLVAPSSFRLEAQVNIGVAFEGTNDAVARIYIQDHPLKSKTILERNLLVKPGLPKLFSVQLNAGDFPENFLNEMESPRLVSLIVQIKDFQKEVLVPISMQSGYMFIQTDKPIYTPLQEVHIRIIPLTEETTLSRRGFKLQIKNPNGFVVEEAAFKRRRQSRPTFEKHVYKFSKYPVMGKWSITVLYGYQMEQNISTYFDLREYVLPAISVKVTYEDPLLAILPHSSNFSLTVDAKYIHGVEMDRSVTLRVGVENTKKTIEFFKFIPPSFVGPRHPYSFVVNTSDIKAHKNIGWFPEIENSYLVVQATVEDLSSEKRESVTSKVAIFAQSPFTISFKRCLKDFKPGLASVFEADINHIDGRPAPDISVKISVKADDEPLYVERDTAVSDKYGKVSFEIHPGIQHERLTITLETMNPVNLGSNISGTFEQFKYRSNSTAYVAFNRTSIHSLKPGDNFVKMIHLEPKTMQDVYYLVVSKGKILIFNKMTEGNDYPLKVEFEVTYEMVPSFRITVFIHHEKELLADSLNIQVERDCHSDSKITITPDFEMQEPGETGTITIKGSERNLVGLTFVDEAVYEVSKNYLLTKDMVFEEMSSHDFGCGPGGGITTSSVLENAGIILASNHFTPLIPRTSRQLRRRKRKALKIKDSDSNDSRIGEENVHDVKRSKRSPSEAEEHILDHNITILKDFKETWIFDDIEIEGYVVEIPARLPSSTTTWMLQAVSASFEQGFCVAETSRISSSKTPFLQPSFPYSAVTNKQVEIPITVYGLPYTDPQVYIYDDRDICEGALPGLKTERQILAKDWYRTISYSTYYISFPIIPMKPGTYDIKLMMVTRENSEIVQKQLQVVMEGVRKEKSIPILLDPTNVLRRTKNIITTDLYTDFIDTAKNVQVITLLLSAPPESVPGSASFSIEVMGKQQGPVVQTIVNNTESLLKEPQGYGEENMMYLAPTIYTIRYLKAIGNLTSASEEKGLEFMKLGYNSQLAFRWEDGSYSAFDPMPSSTWLTAFVMKVFGQASNFIDVNSTVLCSGIRWLMKQQRRDGSFTEGYRVADVDMMGGVLSDTSMTAFVLITLEECPCEEENLSVTKKRALSYLENHFAELNASAEVAMVAYALSLGRSDLKSLANDKLLSLAVKQKDPNMLHWEKEYPELTIETAGYALLNQLLLDDMEASNAIVNWLNTKQLESGIFSSIQDTVIALQALSEYLIKTQMQTINLVSNILSNNDPLFHKVLTIQESNAHVLQEVQVDEINDTLIISTMGTGVGKLNVKIHYNIASPAQTCKFNISVSLTEYEEEETEGESDIQLRIKISVCARHLGVGDADLTFIEVGLFPGFTAEFRALSQLRYQHPKLLYFYKPSVTGVTFYFEKVPANENLCFQFHVVRNFDAGKIFSRFVKIYEYSNPDEYCTVFYSLPGSRYNVLSTAFYNGTMECRGGGCPPENPFSDMFDQYGYGKASKKQLVFLFCKKYDYVWITKLFEFKTIEGGLRNLTFYVDIVVKEGIEKKISVKGEIRSFLMRSCGITFEMEREYLIVEKDKQNYTNDYGQIGYRYLLDENTIVFEYNWNKRISGIWLIEEVLIDIYENGCPS